ncbi:MAG TPA: DegV family protein [Patescibacteria group bacterium]|nr:DegV family protein [Patescibacteria group bacterium]
MSPVAIVTDSASDLDPAVASRLGIVVVPLIVSFGSDSYRAGVDLTPEAFWERMIAPDAPFPTTAASSPGVFKEAFEGAFAAGADAIVCVTVGSGLSGTFKSAQVARDLLADREIHLVDSKSASMGQGLLVILAAELAQTGVPADGIARTIEGRADDVLVAVCLDTLEYLKKGGRISGPQAAIGSLLGVKPIISIKDGAVDTVDRVRTRTKARARAIEFIMTDPIERLSVLHTVSPDVAAFRTELEAHAPGGIDPSRVSVDLVGPSVGPHLGPGAVGAAVLRKRQG